MKLRLLLANDDGLDSPFLPPFAAALSRVADVLIAVPDREQSWVGRDYNRRGKVAATRRDFFGFECYTISGTPSDCVNIALGHLCGGRPDAVVSGLNIGQNIALPLLWSSGTFSAAVEGAGWGIPSYAFSMRLDNQYYEYCRLRAGPTPAPLLKNIEAASEHAAEFLEKNLAEKECGRGEVVNVNYPIGYTRECLFKKCAPALASLRAIYNKGEGGAFEFSYKLGECRSPNGEITDLECLDAGFACRSKIAINKF